MYQGLTVLIVSLFVGVCIVALFVALRVLFRNLVEDTSRAAEESPGRAFLIGLVNFLFTYALLVLLGRLVQTTGLQFLDFINVILIVILSIGLVFGLSGMVELFSEKLLPDRTGWRRTAGSAATLTLACITPYVGWFGLLPYLGFRGLGAFVMALFARARTEDKGEDDE
ncbi:MAG: hypothetical protein GTO14_12000 [Anaerolineales bacterium]|nr:hypothetical protein [Anaerolineales bacterium]